MLGNVIVDTSMDFEGHKFILLPWTRLPCYIYSPYDGPKVGHQSIDNVEKVMILYQRATIISF